MSLNMYLSIAHILGLHDTALGKVGGGGMYLAPLLLLSTRVSVSGRHDVWAVRGRRWGTQDGVGWRRRSGTQDGAGGRRGRAGTALVTALETVAHHPRLITLSAAPAMIFHRILLSEPNLDGVIASL